MEVSMDTEGRQVLTAGDFRGAAGLAEAMRRDLGRTTLLGFMSYCWQDNREPFVFGRHTREMCRAIDNGVARLLRGQSTYLDFRVPINHGKSHVSSRYGPAYCLGRLAQSQRADMIIASHSADMSAGFSRYVQELVESPQYSVLFPRVRVSRRLSGAKEWGLEGRDDRVNAVGIGTGTSGMRGSVIVLDDYFGNYQDSMSEAMQKGAWDMFRNDLISRMAAACLILVVATPWNLQGVQARIEEEEKRNENFPKFTRVRYRARWPKADGSGEWEYLFPERLPASWYKDQYGVLLPFEIAGKLDCDPVPLSGNVASRAWFPVVERGELPPVSRRARWWDTAATKKKGSDQTVGLRGFMSDVDGTMYLDDAVCDRMAAPEVPAVIRAVAGQDGGMTIVLLEREPGSQGPIACAMMVQMLGGFPVVVALTGGKAKLVRNMPMLTAAKGGRIRVVRGPWNDTFWRQVDTFTGSDGSGHDDFVDAAGGLWRHFAGTLECDSVLGGSVRCTY